MKNKSGAFVAPDLASTSAAGEGIKIPDDLGISTINAPGAKAYPITSQTFVTPTRTPASPSMKKGDAQALAAFLDYALGEGQGALGQLSTRSSPPRC